MVELLATEDGIIMSAGITNTKIVMDKNLST